MKNANLSLKKALIATDVTKVKEYLSGGTRIDTIMKIGQGRFPIYHIPYCWDYLLIVDEYKEDVKEEVAKARKRNDDIIDIIYIYTGINVREYEPDIKNFLNWGHEICTSISDLCETFEYDYDYLINHYRRIDVDLAAAIDIYDFDMVEELLAKGANYDVCFYDGSDGEPPADKASDEYEKFMDENSIPLGNQIFDDEMFLCCELCDIPVKMKMVRNVEYTIDKMTQWYAAVKMIRRLEKGESLND